MTHRARHITKTLSADADKVYSFAANPENLPQWASGLSTGIRREGPDWVTESPMGKVKVKMTEKNSYGILDHDVTLPDGSVVHNPLRILKNGTGCEVVFTLFRLEGVTDEAFEKDAKHIQKDLEKLASLF